MSQPEQQQAYETRGNPADQNSAERYASDKNAASDAPAVDQRVPTKQTQSVDEATPSSLGYGVRGAGPGEEARGYKQSDFDDENEPEQMGAPGEGKVDSAVKRKAGASGNEPGLETDLEKKKAEQAPARETVQADQQRDIDVGGILGQRGGPANPVD